MTKSVEDLLGPLNEIEQKTPPGNCGWPVIRATRMGTKSASSDVRCWPLASRL